MSHNRHYRMAATMSTDRHTVLQLARMHTQETVFFINSYHQHSYDAESQKNHQSSCVIKMNFLLLTSVCVHQGNIDILNCWKHRLCTTNTNTHLSILHMSLILDIYELVCTSNVYKYSFWYHNTINILTLTLTFSLSQMLTVLWY